MRPSSSAILVFAIACSACTSSAPASTPAPALAPAPAEVAAPAAVAAPAPLAAPAPEAAPAPIVAAAAELDHRSRSVGSPSSGTIVDAVELPDDAAYTRASPSTWGSASTIHALREGLLAFRRDVGGGAQLIVSDLSRREGGRLEPHRSHQSGRDVDLWLPARAGVDLRHDGARSWRRPLGDEIDWTASWKLVRALVGTGALQRIYLDWSRQKDLYEAAAAAGATEAELAWIQYPRSKASPEGIVVHAAEHLSHIHARFGCAAWETDCVDGDEGRVD